VRAAVSASLFLRPNRTAFTPHLSPTHLLCPIRVAGSSRGPPPPSSHRSSVLPPWWAPTCSGEGHSMPRQIQSLHSHFALFALIQSRSTHLTDSTVQPFPFRSGPRTFLSGPPSPPSPARWRPPFPSFRSVARPVAPLAFPQRAPTRTRQRRSVPSAGIPQRPVTPRPRPIGAPHAASLARASAEQNGGALRRPVRAGPSPPSSETGLRWRSHAQSHFFCPLAPPFLVSRLSWSACPRVPHVCTLTLAAVAVSSSKSIYIYIRFCVCVASSTYGTYSWCRPSPDSTNLHSED